MKFDPKKPYGVITGHAWARFEQDGVLYDSLGNAEIQDDPEITSFTEPEKTKEIELIFSAEKKDFALNNARDFLMNILADGALPRSVIFKESAANNQEWEKVKTAFAGLGGEAFQRRNVIHWKLKPQ